MTKSAGTFWDYRESADSLPSDLLIRMAVRPLIAASPRPAATDSSGSVRDGHGATRTTLGLPAKWPIILFM
jgi:hypothetical protein